MPLDPIQQFGVTATLGEFGEFEKVSGGNSTTTFTPHYEAGSRSPSQVPGTHEYSDIVLERAYRPDRDAALRNWDAAFKAGFEVGRVCTKLVKNYQGFVVDTIVWPNCEPVSVEFPDGEAGGNAIAMIRVTLKVSSSI